MTLPSAVPHESIAAEQAERPLFQDIAHEMHEWLGEDASGHDMDHAWRVFTLAIRIAESEGADIEIAGAAALVHDIHRVLCEPGEFVHPEESLPEVRAVLERAHFPGAKISKVSHCVAVHDEYDFRGDPDRTESVEARILQDADNLDAIGAVGIARNFAFTGIAGNPLWDPNGEDPSGIGHTYTKLLSLKDEMYTELGRELAAERHDFHEAFVERFEREWRGEL